MHELAIKDVAELTGIAAGTIRMWEQRYGFPTPGRTDGGYRRYTPEDVEALRRVIAYRHRGLSVPAALARARDAGAGTDRPSIYAAVATAEAALPARALRTSTLLAISRAIEDEALARAARPVVFAAFQREAFYAEAEYRYDRLAGNSDATVVFADFDRVTREAGRPAKVPIAPADALGNEWAVIVDAPGYAACLLGWERPNRAGARGGRRSDRRFEAIWTLDPETTRRAAVVAARLAGRQDPDLGEHLMALLADRPLAVESPTPTLTALTNRIVDYLEAAQGPPEAQSASTSTTSPAAIASRPAGTKASASASSTDDS